MASYTSKIYAKEILDIIPNKRIIVLERDKNKIFMEKYSITTEDINDIVYSLNPNCFIERIDNKDKKIKSKYLYVFNVIQELNDEYGETLEKLYIKICAIDEYVLLVSIHLINEY